MVAADRRLAALALSAALALAGCGIVPQGRFDAVQAQNRTLTEQSKAQLAEIENLKIHSRNVENQLIRTEEDLARLVQQHGVDRQKLNNLAAEREQLADQFGGASGPGAMSAAISGRLADLSRRYPSLQYDPKTGVSKLDTDVLFDSGGTELKPGPSKLLSEFAEILQAPEARDLKVMVVGHTDAQAVKGRDVRHRYPNNWHLSSARALAVADKLRQAGISEERMGVAGYGQHQPISPNDTAESRRLNRRVELFVVGPETPVVGWTETIGSVYR